MLKVNARFLTKSPQKAVGLFILLERKRFPDLVAVTELGCGPEMDKLGMKAFLGDRLCSQYSVHFRTRTCTHLGGAVGLEAIIGGGVMLLVRRSLCVDVRKLSVPVPEHDARYVNGHVGVWRLSPKQSTPPPAPAAQACPRLRFVLSPPFFLFLACASSRSLVGRFDLCLADALAERSWYRARR
jgi:hypothetical protein